MKKIKLDKDLYESLKRVSERNGYANVDEFTSHILEKYIEFVAESADEDDPDIMDRLKGLGYI